MLKLNNITLVTVDGCDLNGSIKALKYSSKYIEFGEVVLISNKIYSGDGITSYKISDINCKQYQEFMIFELNKYIHTDFALVIQPDGFVINSDKWTNEFLNYDYIGASWNCNTHILKSSVVSENGKKLYNQYKNVCGNGGFSLRSKKLLECCEHSTYKCSGPEDAYICLEHLDYFIGECNMKYGTLEIANKFSQDPLINKNDTFGFHGNKGLIHNL